MISTLERDNSIEGILFRKMKELPMSLGWQLFQDIPDKNINHMIRI